MLSVLSNNDSCDIKFFAKPTIKPSMNKSRSLNWRLWLGILPEDPKKWSNMLQKQRDGYQDLKIKFMFDPSSIDGDLNINNPLSLEEEAWII